MTIIKNKIFQINDFLPTLSKWKAQNQQLVFTNGCFDLLHRGHVDYLQKAAQLGDKLIIGLNTDASVSRIKGDSRPIQDELSRAELLSAFGFVDAVIFFDDDTPYELIKTIIPDILVKGADYNPEDIIGYDIVVGNGGKVSTIEFLEGYSTSSIIEKIKKYG